MVLASQKPKVSGRDYSVFNPSKVRQGLRIWTESFIQALPRIVPEEEDSRLKD